jgi:uncharacterized protein YrrD
MLRIASELKRYDIVATDGRLGTVSDFLFDDTSWKIRWLVDETGGWLSGRKVLIHPSAIGQADDVHQRLTVNLTTAAVRDSPGISQHEPVSLQIETSLYGYYGWDPLWAGRCFGGGAIAAPLVAPALSGLMMAPDRPPGGGQDPHLRSCNAVTGYHVHGSDHAVGHVEGFLLDDQGWTVRYLIVDTHNWWPGDHVLLPTAAVSAIDWSSRAVRVTVTRAQVQSSPPWPREVAISSEYERRLYAHYDWPGYAW